MGTEESWFEGLSAVGWLGILLWIAFIATVLIKKEWFINYDERFPKLTFVSEILYEEWHFWVFMVARFIFMVLALIIITKIMFAI